LDCQCWGFEAIGESDRQVKYFQLIVQEIPINHFLDMAYDMTLFTSPNSTDTWLSQFSALQFGDTLSSQVASLINTYSHLAARRKYELIDASIFSVVNYNEADTVLSEWHTLVSSAQAIYDSLPAASQPAFFQLVLHPAKAGSILYDLYVSTAKNNLYAKQGRVSAVAYGDMAKAAFAADKELAGTYHKMLGGKWNHMMDQTHIGYTSW
jgi:hypothetical protein